MSIYEEKKSLRVSVNPSHDWNGGWDGGKNSRIAPVTPILPSDRHRLTHRTKWQHSIDTFRFRISFSFSLIGPAAEAQAAAAIVIKITEAVVGETRDRQRLFLLIFVRN